MRRFIYSDVDKAVEDLKIMCDMYSLTNRHVHVCKYLTGYRVTTDLDHDEQPIAIGINGQVYFPRKD